MPEILNLFSIPIFVENINNYCDDGNEIISTTIKDLKKENWSLNSPSFKQTESGTLHKNLRYSKLVNFFESVLNDIKTKYHYDTEKFEIINMWANKSSTNGFHKEHFHTNSYLSGVFYLTGGSEIFFNDPVNSRSNTLLFVKSSLDNSKCEIKPIPGSLIVFPSWLVHGTNQNKDIFERVSISFNTFPQGKINFNSGETFNYSKLDIKELGN